MAKVKNRCLLRGDLYNLSPGLGGGRGFGVRDKVGVGSVMSQPHRIRDRD